MALSPGEKPKSLLAALRRTTSLTPEKVELGKMLFFEPRISASGVISAPPVTTRRWATPTASRSRWGHAGQVGERNTPTVLNSGFFVAQFWDGRTATLEEQALGPRPAGGRRWKSSTVRNPRFCNRAAGVNPPHR
jgi:cytochrome c peroxidase